MQAHARSPSPSSGFTFYKSFKNSDVLDGYVQCLLGLESNPEYHFYRNDGNNSKIYNCRFYNEGCRSKFKTTSTGNTHMVEVSIVGHRLDLHKDHGGSKARLTLLGKESRTTSELGVTVPPSVYY